MESATYLHQLIKIIVNIVYSKKRNVKPLLDLTFMTITLSQNRSLCLILKCYFILLQYFTVLPMPCILVTKSIKVLISYLSFLLSISDGNVYLVTFCIYCTQNNRIKLTLMRSSVCTLFVVISVFTQHTLSLTIRLRLVTG